MRTFFVLILQNMVYLKAGEIFVNCKDFIFALYKRKEYDSNFDKSYRFLQFRSENEVNNKKLFENLMNLGF